jgi:tetratricopeptide (TPR) repeat protein
MQISSSYLELDDERAKLSDAEENWFEEDRPAYELKRFDEAIDASNQAIRLNPNDTIAYSNKGWALCEAKHFEEAGLFVRPNILRRLFLFLNKLFASIPTMLSLTVTKAGLWANLNSLKKQSLTLNKPFISMPT